MGTIHHFPTTDKELVSAAMRERLKGNTLTCSFCKHFQISEQTWCAKVDDYPPNNLIESGSTASSDCREFTLGLGSWTAKYGVPT